MKSNTRPLLTYTILVAVVIMGLGVLLAQLTRNYFVNIFEERIEAESQYFATYMERYEQEGELNKKELYDLSKQLNTGMVFISNDGEILADTVSAVPVVTENEKDKILTRVKTNNTSAREGELIDSVFYYPLPIDLNNIDGTLILLSRVHSLTNITKNIWLLIGFTLVLGLLVILIIGYNIFSKFIRPIRSAADVATELAKGNYKARTYEGHFGEAGQLSRAINILARNLQEMTSKKGMQESQLEAVINNMGNGLVLIDEKGYILLVNRAFLESFGGEAQQYIGHLYHESIPFTTIHETIQKIYMFEETLSETFVLPLGIDRKHLEVTGAPFLTVEENGRESYLFFTTLRISKGWNK
ncbi:PAS domain-containing protein [Halobacillus salinarum]|uniref:PAS domain-containing protein n=1 Tax=Halobacillus salinarum TaxID=2932257 RepID=A0ABY4EQB7_9BACI|nr:PAS domain-containing protein [Halobacillus salinarum]UOQ46175.1 PAS domain-containing protein [Halobacillus salinarum]